MRTTIRLPDDLLREAKKAAAATNRSLTKVIEDSLRESLARASKSTGARPVSLPVFEGRGLRPGVNLDDNAALRDVMDGLDDPS